MTSNDDQVSQMDELLATPDLADALESEQFKRFLDQIPIAIIVSELKEQERIVYANPEFEKLCGQRAAEVAGKPWSVLDGARDETVPDAVSGPRWQKQATMWVYSG